MNAKIKKNRFFNAMLLWSVFVYATGAQAQIIATVAGNGATGYGSDDVAATTTSLFLPKDVTLDPSGNLYICDGGNHRLRKVNPLGIITTIAGTGVAGYSGDSGPATAAQLNNPASIAIDVTGNIYISDNGNNCLRKVDTSGIITTIAGNTSHGYIGDGGPATAARFSDIHSIACDGTGNIYIADGGNNCIRKITASDTIYTIAGNGTPGYSGDGGMATAAQLQNPYGVGVDENGNLYIGDLVNFRIRKVDTSGHITTFMGNGTPGYSGDGGPATAAIGGWNAQFVETDTLGNIYISDIHFNHLRKINSSDTVYTIAGNGMQGFSGDGGAATNAELFSPAGMAVDTYGNVYFADVGNNRVRKIALPVITITSSASDVICAGTSVTYTSGVTNDATTPIYQWRVNGVNAGTGAATYVTDTLPPGRDTVICVLTYVFGDTVTKVSNAIIMQVDTFPEAGAITGPDSVCLGIAATLANAASGGAWSSSNGNATVSGGVVTGVAVGTDTVLYIVANACGRDTAAHVVSVKYCPETSPRPSPGEREVLSVLPNPNGGAFSFNLSSGMEEGVRVEITNVMGERVKELVTTTNKATDIKLDVATGVYFISAVTEHGRWNAKVVVER